MLNDSESHVYNLEKDIYHKNYFQNWTFMYKNIWGGV